MSKRKGKSRKSEPNPGYRMKRGRGGKIRQIKKSRPATERPGFYAAHKTAITASVSLAVIILLALVVMRIGLAPDYDACWAKDSTTPVQQSYHFSLFIQITNKTGLATQFIKIPEKMGYHVGCVYPLYAGYRGLEFVAINVAAPYTQAQHAYTLGDFFTAWGRWTHDENSSLPDRAFAFSPTRVLAYQTSDLQVRISANQNMTGYTLDRGYGAAVMQPNLFYQIWARSPVTDLGTDY